MELYHGSEKIIRIPSFDLNNKANDYGKGFYCTESKELAKEWACKKNQNGFANHYELNQDGLNICYLNSEQYHILHWLTLLTKYRGYWQKHSIAEEAKDFLQSKYLINLSEFDVIIGYRADDSYFSFAADFVMGAISLQTLAKAMKLGKLGEQIVLKSKRAYQQLQYIDNEIALAEIYYSKKCFRDLDARRGYGREKQRSQVDDIYMIDIMRGRVTEDDLRI